MRKLILWLFLANMSWLISCSGSKSNDKPDSVGVDSINGNQPSDSIEIIRNPDENQDNEGEDAEEENNDAPLTPQES